MLHGLEQIESITINHHQRKGEKAKRLFFLFYIYSNDNYFDRNKSLIGEFNCTFTTQSGSLPESGVLKFIDLKNCQNFHPAYY